jgi:hypothetical protein
MEVTIDSLTYDLSQLDPNRIRVVVSYTGIELGTLYFERAKVGFNKKPIGLNSWACVDAKVEGLYVYGGENITPKDIIGKCQDLIREMF